MTDPNDDQTIDETTREADAANGEPDATTDHPTGERQAEENRENDPPA